jgi:basic membrane lipoprotein Med (substrate-binding protein (PBP1-ABC) superfamily)
MRMPGHRELLLLGVAAVAGTAAALTAFGVMPWEHSGRVLPPARARAYNNVTACLLTGKSGLADTTAAQEWAGLEAASRATDDRVSYLAAAGPATAAGAAPYVGTLLVRGCAVIVAAGAPQRAAVLAAAAAHPATRFVVTGPAQGSANLTSLPFTTSGLSEAVASAVEAQLHALTA